MLPKILWVKKNQEENFKKTYKFISSNDYLIGRLTGKYLTDYLNAQKYHYDCINKCYPIELLKELEINIDCLPEVVSPGTIAGTIKEDIANLLNLNKNVQVIVTSYDAICSFFGSGPSEEGDASDVSGTVTTFRVWSEKKDIRKSNKIFSQPFYDLGINIIWSSIIFVESVNS